MGDSFENFNTGMTNLRESFKDISKQKKEKEKQLRRQQFSDTLVADLRQRGAPEQMINSIRATIAAGGGEADPLQAVKFAYSQLPNYAQDAINKAWIESMSGPGSQDEKMTAFKLRVSQISQALNMSNIKLPPGASELLGAPSNAEKIQQFKEKSKVIQDRSLQTYKSQYDYAINNPKPMSAEQLKRATIPNVMDDQLYPPNLTDDQVKAKILAENPLLPTSARDDLLEIWQNKSSRDSKVRKWMQNQFDFLKQNTYDQIFRQANPPPAPPQPGVIQTPAPSGSPADFFQTPNP